MKRLSPIKPELFPYQQSEEQEENKDRMPQHPAGEVLCLGEAGQSPSTALKTGQQQGKFPLFRILWIVLFSERVGGEGKFFLIAVSGKQLNTIL